MNDSMASGAQHNERHYARDMLRVVSAALTYVLPRDIADEVAIELDFSLRLCPVFSHNSTSVN